MAEGTGGGPVTRLNIWDIAAGVFIGNLATALILGIVSILLYSR
jgi:fructose-1,6-bisphosphatase/inositol monophosphatase family enzyme